MKSIQNYSINVKVLEEFNDEVEAGGRSEVVEALIIEFLIKYTRGITPSNMVLKPTSSAKKEVH